ncbi:zinc metalloprotease HtpX [Hyphomicrobium sp. LHD-15]|uniref:zinc metalloprotease HtpX n=1 Tax=Hyphomicrobium sp. LHD-15 TaxID=3072142 RepID=UPI00280CF212|nr:zinc metalloprotease HtpX [Hyphomicrobium sp. LHD-15]MDQ8699503.1 zinc metalloprotease HtpX [Hyphomicrobium sp. LHD-15]
MAKLYFASLVTLSLLTAMVAGVVIAALVAMGSLDVGMALLMVLAINTLIFFISPWLTDLMLKWVNQVAFIDDKMLAARYPHIHAIIHDVAREYGFTAPSVGIIPDRNPTAFTYGLFRSNARIILTDGIFEFLNEEEARAVTAHELGHIVNRDFLVMTVAGTLVQMLYVIYSSLTRRPSGGGNSKSKNNLFIVGIVAYVMYLLGTYILLYLSRTREYLADSFSAERVEARHLANALVKIAYGIAEAADTEQSRELLASTRHMGSVDFKGARHLGLVVEASKTHPEATANAMLFDIYNPWAKLIELSSTHPLTGKRIQALATIANHKRQAFPDIDVEAAAKRANVNPSALWTKFWREVGVLVLPVVVAAIVGLWGLASETPALALLAVPAGIFAWLAFIPIIYPSSAPANETVVDLMGDVAASPVIGRPVRLEGEVIGRVDAGSVFGEDTVFADPSGRINVDFRSLLGPLGDLWTGWRRIKPHINQKGSVTGWFRRGMGGFVIMKELDTTAGRVRAYPYFAGIGTAVFVLLLVGVIALFTT